MKRFLVLVLLTLIVLTGCSRKQEVERAETPGADANTEGPLVRQPAVPDTTAAGAAQGAAPLGAVEAVIRDFAAQEGHRGDTLYVALAGHQDPPSALFVRLNGSGVVARPLSKRPHGEAGTALYITGTAGGADTVGMKVHWEKRAQGAAGHARAAQRGGRWAVVDWHWMLAN